MGFWKSLGYRVVEEEEYNFKRFLDRTITSSSSSSSSSSSFRDRDRDLVHWPGLMGRSQTGSRQGCSWFLQWCSGSLRHRQRSWGCQCRWCELGSEWEHGANRCPKFESLGRKPTTNLISTALPLSTLIQTTLQQKKFITTKKNRCNNIEVITIVYAKCCNKIWGNKFVLQENFIAINLKYFNENFNVIIYLLLQ